jgi:hypothetical protein
MQQVSAKTDPAIRGALSHGFYAKKLLISHKKLTTTVNLIKLTGFSLLALKG